jgi:hypothetical protein
MRTPADLATVERGTADADVAPVAGSGALRDDAPRGAPVVPGGASGMASPGAAAALPWLLACAGALLLDVPAPVGGAAAAALGLVIFRRDPALAALAAVAGALGGSAAAGDGWLLTGAAVALAADLRAPAAGRTTAGSLARPDELVHELARCRRTGGRADVVVAACTDPAAAVALAARLRLSDSVRVHGAEVHAMLDRDGLDRAALERRLAADAPARFGWARYPEDGLTADELLRVARPAGPPLAAPAARPARSPVAAVAEAGERATAGVTEAVADAVADPLPSATAP